MRFKPLAAALVVAPLLFGCNTMEQKTFQKVEVITPGVADARCSLYSPLQKSVVLTPREVMVERSPEPLTVVCEKAGYADATTVIQPHKHMPGMAKNVWNGFFPGYFVDKVSNSIYEYTDPIVIAMTPAATEHDYPDLPYVLERKAETASPVPLAASPVAADKVVQESGKK